MNRELRMNRLKSLVDSLENRDVQLKNDAELFNNFFTNFPIPVTMWSLDGHGNILSKRGNTVVKDECTDLKNMFCEEYSKEFKEAHLKAYMGEIVSFFSILPEKTYYTRLVPRFSDQEIIGVTGISWDITSNYDILESLQEISKIASSPDADVKKILSLSEAAIEKSRIKNLMGKKNGE